MADLVIRGARVLALDDADTEYERADIVIADGILTAIAPGAGDHCGAAHEVIDGRGLLAMPGLVNGHFHSPGNLMKGLVPNLPLELFML